MTVQTTALSFDSYASAILKGFKGFDKAQASLSSTINTTMQRFVDHVSVTLGKDQKACEALQKSIRDCQLVINADASGAMKKKTFTEYAQSAARALHYGVPFTTQLKQDDSKKLPWSKSASAQGAPIKGTKAAPKAGTKAGAPTVVNRAELQKTLSIALAQARSLNLDLLAASILDVCLEQFDGFKETILDTKAPM